MKKIIYNNLCNFVFLVWMELIFQLNIFNKYSWDSFSNILLYTIFSSVLITFITNIFSKKINKFLFYTTYTVLPIMYSVQFMFKKMFNNFFAFSVLALSDQALDFAGTVLNLILKNIIYVILFFIPLIFIVIFRKKFTFNNRLKDVIILQVSLILISLSIFYLNLYRQKGEYLSAYSLYYEVNQNSLNVQKLGVLNSYRLDFIRTLFGFEEKIIISSKVEPADDDKVIEYEYNVEELNLDKIKDKNKIVYDYISNNTGTRQNEYTEMFKGKNLIYIVAESFSEIAIKEELTPTLYKLTNSGFIFENFYTPNYLSTIGGEFQALTGLHPSYELLSNWRSGKDYFPYGLSTVFENIGYKTYAYHNHSGYFQDRYKYLKSLGFDNFKACYFGLEKDINCDTWPESDVEMIEATVDDYLYSDEPFLTYYMTVSGHLGYTWGGNSIARKHENEVNDLPYSDKVKAYVATQIELDRALELLIEKLESAGKLDDTLIVLLADHYPYGLNISEINEISTYERDSDFEINHNKLIIYNPNLETKKISKVASSSDVLPTVYNLFGIKYDSRLFTGSDIFSDSEGLVIFQNRSWISDKAIYNSSTNTYEVRGSNNVDDNYINTINNIVNSKIIFSREIINKNCYKDIFS